MISPSDFDERRGYSAPLHLHAPLGAKVPPKVKVDMPKPGTYVIIRCNSDVEIHQEKPTSHAIGKAIGCTVCDTVNLKTHPGYVMMLDDTGDGAGKPPNPIATALYHAQCKPGTKHKICGDVALVWDEDFA